MPQAEGKRQRRKPRGSSWFHDAGDDAPKNLGTVIKLRRTELGLSRRELAERAGLSYPYVAELENGAKQGSPKAIEAIARALELRPSELLAWSDDLAESRGASPSDPEHWRHRGAAMTLAAPAAAGLPPRSAFAGRNVQSVRSSSGRQSPRMLAAEINEVLHDADPADAEEALLMVLGEQRVRSHERDDE